MNHRDIKRKWSLLRWGDIATLEYGRALRGYKQTKGKHPVFGTNGQIGWNSKPLCHHAGVIIGRKGAYRGVHFSPKPFFVIDTAFYLEAKQELDYRWAYYSILSQDINSLDSGSAIPSTSRESFYGLPVLLPPINEQRAIAHILGTLDAKIELNRRMNETLEGMARAIFISWFVDFDPVHARAEGRATGLPHDIDALFPDSFQDSSLGEIPDGWKVGNLEDVLEVLETGSRPKGGVRDFTSGIPSVGAESIVRIGIFDFGKTKYVPVEFFKNMSKGRVQSRDVLLYKDGGRPGEYEPHVSMFGDDFPFDQFCINEHVYRLCASPKVSQNYLYFWLTSVTAMEEMRVKGTGVAIPGLNSTAVKSLSVLIPPAAIVHYFDSLVNPAITRLFSNCRESRDLAVIRDALLPKLISGEIPVPATKEKEEIDVEKIQPFMEAVLLTSIIKWLVERQIRASRFRAQKSIYFVLRRMGLDVTLSFSRRELGPYDPKMRYRGGESLAIKRNYLEAIGQSEFALGPNESETFKYLHSDRKEAIEWVLGYIGESKESVLELLSTVDYTALELNKKETPINVDSVIHFIKNQPEWALKLKKHFFARDKIAKALASLSQRFPNDYRSLQH